MPCGCKKNKADGCGTCVNGTEAGATAWIDCAYWTARPEQDVYAQVRGQVVRYSNKAVRTKESTICDNFVKSTL